jgi:osmotically-inducible protein OsmY
MLQINIIKKHKRSYKTLSLILPFCFTLQSCLPTIFTGVALSTVTAAKDRSVSDSLKDSKISAAVKLALMKDNTKGLYTKITIEVVDQVVFLNGSLEKEEHIIEAVRITWAQNDVREIINELKVDPKSSYFDLTQYSRDSLTTLQIKSKIFAHRDIKAVNYTIITSSDIVYLLGFARSHEELELVADIAAKTKGVKQVIVYVKIKENHNNENSL